ncbi:hypothetical protein [Streptosporangium subroseum]|nr:hypothetical protein [Streptosporangium subroseum]
MTERSEGIKQHSTSVMGPTKEAMTERSEGIKQHSTSVMGPTKEAP